MQNKIIKKLSNEIVENVKNVGGLHEFVKKEENKDKIVNWLELITDISCLFEEQKGFEIEVHRQKYHNCYFKVGRYSSNEKAMYIGIYGIKDNCLDTEDYFIDNVTVFNSKIEYNNKQITIKEEFIPLLKKLEILRYEKEKKFEMSECHNAMDYVDKEFYVCTINSDNLKRFCKDWNYQYE